MLKKGLKSQRAINSWAVREDKKPPIVFSVSTHLWWINSPVLPLFTCLFRYVCQSEYHAGGHMVVLNWTLNLLSPNSIIPVTSLPGRNKNILNKRSYISIRLTSSQSMDSM